MNITDITCITPTTYNNVLCKVCLCGVMVLKLTIVQYPAIHTYYSWSNCTNLQYNHNIWHGTLIDRKEILNTKNNNTHQLQFKWLLRNLSLDGELCQRDGKNAAFL